jgi:hypothetical protein
MSCVTQAVTVMPSAAAAAATAAFTSGFTRIWITDSLIRSRFLSVATGTATPYNLLPLAVHMPTDLETQSGA